jgi:hypothetical protein
MKYQKTLAIWLVLSAILTGCLNDDRVYSSSKFNSDIEQAIATNKVLKLPDVTPFTWEKLYIFTPYTAAKAIEKCLGFTWTEASNTGIEQRDDINLLVFVRNDQAIQHLEYPRSKGDFLVTANCQSFTPATAAFAVKTDKSGYFRLVPQVK